MFREIVVPNEESPRNEAERFTTDRLVNPEDFSAQSEFSGSSEVFALPHFELLSSIKSEARLRSERWPACLDREWRAGNRAASKWMRSTRRSSSQVK
jgi:hypothetical protein